MLLREKGHYVSIGILCLVQVLACYGKDSDAKEEPAYRTDFQDENGGFDGPKPPSKSAQKTVHLTAVACGDRVGETMVMLKSACLLTQFHIHFHLVAEKELHSVFKTQLAEWPEKYRSKVTLTLYKVSYPGVDEEVWIKLFKLCASQRLFLPGVLKKVDSVLYVDTDILFLRPIEDIWAFLKKFNSTQIASLTPEHETPNIGWYNRFAKIPYVPPLGINSGVILMNLTRMREANWTDHIVTYYNKYKINLIWKDQDLINIFFHFFPEKLFQYPCQWNYRMDHCMYGSMCKTAHDEGIAILHGNREVFHNHKQPAIKAVYQAFRDYVFGTDLKTGLIKAIKSKLREGEAASTECGRLASLYTKHMEKQLDRHEEL